eukprot:scaffold741_cov336-Pavlova_lutheri.AAC.48
MHAMDVQVGSSIFYGIQPLLVNLQACPIPCQMHQKPGKFHDICGECYTPVLPTDTWYMVAGTQYNTAEGEFSSKDQWSMLRNTEWGGFIPYRLAEHHYQHAQLRWTALSATTTGSNPEQFIC